MTANNLKKSVVGLRREFKALPKDAQKRIAAHVKQIRKLTGFEQLRKAFGGGKGKGKGLGFHDDW